MRFVSAEEIRRALTFPALVAAMEASHRRPRIAIRDLVMGEERAHYFVRSAVDAGRVLGSKLFTSFPDNLVAGARGEHPVPAVQGVYVLFDGTNGRPRAVLDGTEITWWKTSADSALGARLLAPDNPHTLLVVGAGAMAPWLVRAHRFARPSIRRVLVWNRTQARAPQRWPLDWAARESRRMRSPTSRRRYEGRRSSPRSRAATHRSFRDRGSGPACTWIS